MVSMSTEEYIDTFCKALGNIEDFKYSYEELNDFRKQIKEYSLIESNNSKTEKKPRGPSSWNLFMKAHKEQKLKRDELKEIWSNLSQEEKDRYKSN